MILLQDSRRRADHEYGAGLGQRQTNAPRRHGAALPHGAHWLPPASSRPDRSPPQSWPIHCLQAQPKRTSSRSKMRPSPLSSPNSLPAQSAPLHLESTSARSSTPASSIASLASSCILTYLSAPLGRISPPSRSWRHVVPKAAMALYALGR